MKPCVGEVAVKPKYWLNRHICPRAENGWRVKVGEAGSGDFAKQNATPTPLHGRLFLLNTAGIHLPMIPGASATSRIRIHSKTFNAKSPTAIGRKLLG